MSRTEFTATDGTVYTLLDGQDAHDALDRIARKPRPEPDDEPADEEKEIPL